MTHSISYKNLKHECNSLYNGHVGTADDRPTEQNESSWNVTSVCTTDSVLKRSCCWTKKITCYVAVNIGKLYAFTQQLQLLPLTELALCEFSKILFEQVSKTSSLVKALFENFSPIHPFVSAMH